MLARLGIVLYWAGCVVAGLCLALVLVNLVVGILGGWEAEALFHILVFLLLALIAWIVGLTLRYILAGRNRD